MPTYDEIKNELSEIATLLEKLPEQVRSQAYNLLISEFLGRQIDTPDASGRRNAGRGRGKRARVKKENTTPDQGKSPKKVARAGKESYSIDRNLNLRGDKSMPSFKDFNEEKSPGNAKEFNAVAAYYLQKVAGLKNITLDMAYTCYQEVQRKPPEAFRQSFIDTKNKAGWVEFTDDGHLTVPHRGSVFVEHDLPKASPKEKK